MFHEFRIIKQSFTDPDNAECRVGGFSNCIKFSFHPFLIILDTQLGAGIDNFTT